MLRVVLDTNVLVSGTFWTGDSFKILELVDENKIVGIVSLEILSEYNRILHSSEILEKTDAFSLAKTSAALKLVQKMTVVRPTVRLSAVPDSEDNKFLEAAIEGKAAFVVSQDKHLLKIGSYKEVLIVTPRQFLLQLQKKAKSIFKD